VVVSDRRKVDASASPASVLYLIADTEQELPACPRSYAACQTPREIRIGNELARSYISQDKKPTAGNCSQSERYLNHLDSISPAMPIAGCPTTSLHREPLLHQRFALPGGHVFVGGGLLALMDSEDELASLLGHEIEHIDHYHCATCATAAGTAQNPLGDLIAIPIELFEAGYNKDQEIETRS